MIDRFFSDIVTLSIGLELFLDQRRVVTAGAGRQRFRQGAKEKGQGF
jgi:hypothetical protein